MSPLLKLVVLVASLEDVRCVDIDPRFSLRGECVTDGLSIGVDWVSITSGADL